jgi:hypothetical protein
MSESEPQPPAPIDGRVLASFSDYDGMIDALRARVQERRIAITSPHVAEVSGMPSYYLCKLLSVHPTRRIGAYSLGPLLGVLGVKLVMIEDADAMAKSVHTGTKTWRVSSRAFKKMQDKGRKSRWENMTPEQRSAWVRRKLNKARQEKAAAKKAGQEARAAAKVEAKAA